MIARRVAEGLAEYGLISPMACRRKEYHSFLKDKGPM